MDLRLLYVKLLKFMYSERTIETWRYLPVDLEVKFKSTGGRFRQIFVVFLESMNFKETKWQKNVSFGDQLKYKICESNENNLLHFGLFEEIRRQSH